MSVSSFDPKEIRQPSSPEGVDSSDLAISTDNPEEKVSRMVVPEWQTYPNPSAFWDRYQWIIVAGVLHIPLTVEGKEERESVQENVKENLLKSFRRQRNSKICGELEEAINNTIDPYDLFDIIKKIDTYEAYRQLYSKNLEQLFEDSCFPNELELSTLENWFDEHEGVMKQMETLYLTDVTTVPESICRLSSLTHLNITDHIRFFPESFGQLKNLKRLAFSARHFKKLPHQLCELPSLRMLTIFDNQMEDCDESIILRLKTLINFQIFNEPYEKDRFWNSTDIEHVRDIYVLAEDD